MIPQSDEEAAFLAEILVQPGDDGPRAVYADWLEEHGDPRAEILRIESELASFQPHSNEYRKRQSRLRALRRGVNHNWIVVVARPPIENCRATGQATCPGRWDKLAPTHFPDLRTCWECKQEVQYCRTMREARQHAVNGQPVAVSLTLSRSHGDLARRRY